MAAHDDDLVRARSAVTAIHVAVTALEHKPILRVVRRLRHSVEQLPTEVDNLDALLNCREERIGGG